MGEKEKEGEMEEMGKIVEEREKKDQEEVEGYGKKKRKDMKMKNRGIEQTQITSRK